MSKSGPAKRATKSGERGSALLIVFVFAAIIAIMLFMEMPVAVFEAQRTKEQLLIDRGNEYAHAVKLFVRKTGTYPSSFDALENTNQMRFLRHRFKDPFTGKDDWRLLHAGPNGMLIDSKVPQTGLGQANNGQNGNNSSTNGQNNSSSSSAFGSSSNSSYSPFGAPSTGQTGNATGSNSGSSFGSNSGSSFGSNSGSSFGSNSSSFGSASNADSTPSVVVPALKERAPAVAANGSGQVPGATADQSPLDPLLPPLPGDPNQPGSSQTSASNNTSPGQNGAPVGTNPTTGSSSGTTGTASTNSSSFGSTMGKISTGGIAGVASRASGHSIKVVNDQTNYSLWEFYYNPTKDATQGVASALGSIGGANQQQNGQQQNGTASSNSPFGGSSAFGSGSSNSSSPFGSSSGTSNTNSSTTTTSPTTTATPQATTPQ